MRRATLGRKDRGVRHPHGADLHPDHLREVGHNAERADNRTGWKVMLGVHAPESDASCSGSGRDLRWG